VSRGATNLVGPTAGLCGLLNIKASGQINYHAPTEKSTTHGERSDQLQRTEEESRPGHKGAAKAAGVWLLGHTVYEVCSFRLEDRSVSSVTVKTAFLQGCGIPPRRLGDGRDRKRRRPRERNGVPRRNDPNRTDCRSLRTSYTARQRAGSTTTQRARNVPRTAREANKNHAPK
jgi:hypothetical protein